MSDFNPNSSDSMFARVLERMDQSEQKVTATNAEFLGVLREIRDEARRTNGRVGSLEAWRENVRGRVAVAASVVSGIVAVAAWVIERLAR